MTRNTFTAECSKLTIDPAIALENLSVVFYLQNKNDAMVLKTLNEEF